MLLNLIGNARDAIDANRPSPSDPGKITLIAEDGGAKDEIRLIVCDTGGGIPETALPHISEPFFTTKEAGKGTGLELSISARIVIHVIAEHVADLSPRLDALLDDPTASGAGVTCEAFPEGRNFR